MSPEAVHLCAPREGDAAALSVEAGSRLRRWQDLQLPLYRAFLEEELGEPVACGYFHLPKAGTEAGIEMWDGLTPEMVRSAVRCAEHVGERIAAGEFWPPAERVARDEFARLLLGDAGRYAEAPLRPAATAPGAGEDETDERGSRGEDETDERGSR
jgi:ATP-dependent helicase/nuclease subunit B